MTASLILTANQPEELLLPVYRMQKLVGSDDRLTLAFIEALQGIERKFDLACERLAGLPKDLEDAAYIGTSGGKDSVTTLYLCEAVYGIGTLPIVHSPKPEGVENAVHPLTKEFIYSMDRVVTYCPLKLHGSLGHKTQFDGTRVSEWDRSNGRSVDVVSQGQQISRKEVTLYMRDGLFGLNFVYPIFDWSDEDVWAAIVTFGIPFSPEYAERY